MLKKLSTQKLAPITGTAVHPGTLNEVARTDFLADSANFMQVAAAGAGGRSAEFRPPLGTFLGLEPRDVSLVSDLDLDLIEDGVDNCPTIANPGQEDTGDGVGDACGNCTLVANNDQRDTDADGFGNMTDSDFNGDNAANLTDYAQFGSVLLSTVPGSEAIHTCRSCGFQWRR